MNPTFQCKVCELEFETYSKLNIHNNGTHVDKIRVFIGEDTIMQVDKINGKFNCPECPSKLSSPIAFNIHLNNEHNGHCESTLNKKKRRCVEDDSPDHPQSITLPHHKLPSLHLNLDKIDSNSRSIGSLFSISSPCDYDTGVLLASNAMSLPRSEQLCCARLEIGNQ